MRGFKYELLAGVAAIAVGVGLSQVAGAATGEGPRHERMLEKYDTDHDGKISPEERKAAGDARFKTMDTDGDGFVSREEAREGAAKRASERSERMFVSADADKDGKISQAEFEAARGKMHKHREGRPYRDRAPDVEAE